MGSWLKGQPEIVKETIFRFYRTNGQSEGKRGGEKSAIYYQGVRATGKGEERRFYGACEGFRYFRAT